MPTSPPNAEPPDDVGSDIGGPAAVADFALAQRSRLASRLLARRADLQAAALSRVFEIADPGKSADPDYVDGLRGAVSGAVDHALTLLRAPSLAAIVPGELLAQAQLAARNGVRLDVVLRRYLAGHALLADCLIAEARRPDPVSPKVLAGLLGEQSVWLDKLLLAVSDAHAGAAVAPVSPEHRRRALVRRLLQDDDVSVASLSYDLGGWHLGLIADPAPPGPTLRALANALDCRLLAIAGERATTWAWLGGRRPLDPDALARVWRGPGLLAVGEPGTGLTGWRLTHSQAKRAAALPAPPGACFVRYADVALEAAMFGDELFVESLRQLYLEPLAEGPDGGRLAREALGAYFAAEGNVSSAAAALRIHRHTLAARLRNAEEVLGRPLSSCVRELELALKLARKSEREKSPVSR